MLLLPPPPTPPSIQFTLHFFPKKEEMLLTPLRFVLASFLCATEGAAAAPLPPPAPLPLPLPVLSLPLRCVVREKEQSADSRGGEREVQ